MKLFFFLFTYVAVQGAFADIIGETEELNDMFKLDWGDLKDVVPLVNVYKDLGGPEMVDGSGDASNADPKKCLPHIEPAYKIALEVRRILTEGAALRTKLQDEIKKCTKLSKPEEQKKCAKEALKSVKSEKEALLKAFSDVKPKADDMMDKFKKCLA